METGYAIGAQPKAIRGVYMLPTEILFLRLASMTEQLIELFRSENLTDSQEQIDLLVEERETLLSDLREHLSRLSGFDIESHRTLYESWQAQETELVKIGSLALKGLETRKTEAKQVKDLSGKYNSYLKQMPYGAFLDSKK